MLKKKNVWQEKILFRWGMITLGVLFVAGCVYWNSNHYKKKRQTQEKSGSKEPNSNNDDKSSCETSYLNDYNSSNIGGYLSTDKTKDNSEWILEMIITKIAYDLQVQAV